LRASYASQRLTLTITRTAIVPSLAYAFAVTLYTKADLISWDTLIGNIIEYKIENLEVHSVTPYCVFAELVSETVCLRSDSCWLEILY